MAVGSAAGAESFGAQGAVATAGAVFASEMALAAEGGALASGVFRSAAHGKDLAASLAAGASFSGTFTLLASAVFTAVAAGFADFLEVFSPLSAAGFALDLGCSATWATFAPSSWPAGISFGSSLTTWRRKAVFSAALSLERSREASSLPSLYLP